ncbi:sigma-70 family RNA polymerase sigma factor [Halalkalibacterium halodurans]|uniref:sigma-70 family RNA polymerase sigma factor n=1 Tax=Halalkalibacterium halodurans TaxID=86665 RepID=UPI002E2301A5|nr:sigma-70 family RNA polymerase sigma factor [Halalkalibacterium halodurans]MED4083676.1 sigma-70 family RNA polymerase sigma factor [Halalkalibacterium halodurans]MED4106422.1 sigma-70 family RNA polymerase sigma factor [Halalkalibacterium halodurans]MED4107833.1 sigma-70 family RNA polymerase sigma factor [Halalkalibacterium halodurans]MED4148753.1 sigma-70 family RNA polymerase sigma factor [Halalkalibacterium halodurans]
MSFEKTSELSEKSRELQEVYQQLVEDVGLDLWRFCRYLTGSPWDGEDLYQETLVKAFGSLYQRWQPTNPKAYLFRIATNTWIDQCRKAKRIVGTVDEMEGPVEEFSNDLELEHAFTRLFTLFPPRQVAVFLLKDVFAFTAEEVASMVRSTSNGVYATSSRVRKKLKETASLEEELSSNGRPSPEQSEVIQQYVEAFNAGDLGQLFDLMSDEVHIDASLGFQEYSKEEMKKGSMQYGLPGFRAEPFVLWGKTVLVVLVDRDAGPLIHDIQFQEIENGKIVYHKSYYFCKEFLMEAAKELQLQVQLDKAAVHWRHSLDEGEL